MRRHVLRRLLIGAFLSLSLTALAVALNTRPAVAFKTFRAFGGAIHEAITREAIGSEVSNEAFRIIDGASTRQDIPGTQHFEDPAHHFVDGSLRPSIRYSQEMWRKARDYARDADRDRKMRGRALEAIGFFFHTIQDFYAHSNYIELALKAGVQPDRIDRMKWERQDRPKNLRTGYFFYSNAAVNELTVSRTTAIYQLQQIYPAARFVNVVRYEHMRSDPTSYDQAIAYATGDYDFLHIEVEKDNASSLQGRVVHPRSGLTLHEIARRVAVTDTRYLWHTLLNEVKRDGAERGGAIVGALTGHAGIVCPPTLAGYPLTRRPQYQGGIQPDKSGSLAAHCRYGDETDTVNDRSKDRHDIKIHVAVTWAERPIPNIGCGTLRQMMAQMNRKEERYASYAQASATRWAAVAVSTVGMPESSATAIRALAGELLRQVEPRSIPCGQ